MVAKANLLTFVNTCNENALVVGIVSREEELMEKTGFCVVEKKPS